LWCFFFGVVCEAVVVGVVVGGGVDCFGLGELLSCQAATAATIATMTPMATIPSKKEWPTEKEQLLHWLRKSPDRISLMLVNVLVKVYYEQMRCGWDSEALHDEIVEILQAANRLPVIEE